MYTISYVAKNRPSFTNSLISYILLKRMHTHCGITFTRDYLLIQDSGVVDLDWAVRLKDQNPQANGEQYPGERAPGRHTSTPSVLIVIPNALGKITHNLLSLCHVALQQNFYPVAFHHRDHEGRPLTTPRYQEFGILRIWCRQYYTFGAAIHLQLCLVSVKVLGLVCCCLTLGNVVHPVTWQQLPVNHLCSMDRCSLRRKLQLGRLFILHVLHLCKIYPHNFNYCDLKSTPS